VSVDVASDGISSAAYTVPGTGEEDFLAVQTPRAYSTSSLLLDHGTSGRYQGIATGVCTAVGRILGIEPFS